MDNPTRAQAAVKLLQAAMRDDNESATEFLADVIERGELWRCCITDDADEPFRSYADFVAAINAEFDDSRVGGTAPVACARPDNRALCQMTTDERYRLRRAQFAQRP